MIITFNGKIETDSAEEKEVFKAMKDFMNSNFQNYEFSVSGKKETLRDEWHRPKEIEPIKPSEPDKPSIT